MNFVILDLEWDSTYYVKEHRFFNQIIQIGAVKLDEKLNIRAVWAMGKLVEGTYTL